MLSVWPYTSCSFGINWMMWVNAQTAFLVERSLGKRGGKIPTGLQKKRGDLTWKEETMLETIHGVSHVSSISFWTSRSAIWINSCMLPVKILSRSFTSMFEKDQWTGDDLGYFSFYLPCTLKISSHISLPYFSYLVNKPPYCTKCLFCWMKWLEKHTGYKNQIGPNSVFNET